MSPALDLVVATVRAMTFFAVLQAAGAALFLVIFRERLTLSSGTVRAIGAGAAAVGACLTVVRYLLEPARMAGSLAGIFDGFMHGILLSTNLSVTQLIRLLGTVIVGLLLVRPTRLREDLSLIGATLIVVSFSYMGHTAASDQRWILSALLIVHLFAVAFWFGALAPLYVACGRETLTDAGELIADFSIIATRTVPLILVAGIIMTWTLLPSLSSLGTPYGQLLLAKIAGFTALMGFAALNKFRFGPDAAAGNQRSLNLFRRSVAMEAALIALILGMTAAMTTLYSPDQ